MKATKILLYIFSGLALLVLGLVLFIRIYLTDERLRQTVEPLMQEQLGREVTIGSLEVRLLRSFPDLSVGVGNLAIHTPARNDLMQPDLARVERIWVDVALLPLLQSNIHVRALELDAPQILVEVYDDLSSNLIELGQDMDREEAVETESPLKEIALERIRIRDAQVGYVHADGTVLTLSDMNADLSARLGETARIDGSIDIGDTYFEAGGIPYTDHWSLTLALNAEAHPDSAWLRIDTAELQVEDLLLQLAGSVEDWDKERIGVDLRLDAPEASVAEFWSLLPETIVKDAAGLQSSGVFTVHATLQGFVEEGSMPALLARVALRDGTVTYPGVPSSIQNLVLDAEITNDVLTVSRLHAEADGTVLDLNGSIRNYASPILFADVNVDADLGEVERYYPLEDGTQLSGRLTVDTELNGPLAQSSGISATGYIALDDIDYASSTLEQPVENLSGRIVFNDDQVALNDISFVSGRSDLRINGTMVDYRAFLDESTPAGAEPYLQGVIRSEYLNITEQLSEDTTSTFVGPLELPAIRMDVALEADRVEFNGISLNQATGRLMLDDGTVGIDEVSARLLGGVLGASGRFDLSDPLQPLFEGAVSLERLPVSEFFSTFSDMAAIVRIGSYLEGLFDTEAAFELRLDKDLNPLYESVVAEGVFGAQQAQFGTTPLQSALSNYLGLSAIESLSVQDWSHDFSVSGERLHVQNLQLDAGNYSFALAGTQGFDGTIDYRLTVELPESASNALANAPVQGALSPIAGALNVALVEPSSGRITLDLAATGSFANPTVRLDTDMMQARLSSRASALAAGARREAQARLDSLENAARARAEAELAEQRKLLEERAGGEINSLVDGLIDSSSVGTDIDSLGLDSLKQKGAEALQDRLRGLLNRNKRNN